MRCRGKEYGIITAATWLKQVWEPNWEKYISARAEVDQSECQPLTYFNKISLMPSDLFNIILSLMHVQNILDWFLSKLLMSVMMCFGFYKQFYKQGLSAP